MKITQEQLLLLRTYVVEEEEARYQQDRVLRVGKSAKEAERSRDLAYAAVRSQFDLTNAKPARVRPLVVKTGDCTAVIIRTDGTPLVADLAE